MPPEAIAQTPIASVVEGLLFVLEAISFFAVLSLIYSALLTRHEHRKRPAPWKRYLHGAAFVVLIGLILAGAHHRAWFGSVWQIPAVLLTGFTLCAVYYFSKVRTHWSDDRVQYAMLLWAAFWILVCLLLGLVYWIDRKGGTFEIGKIDAASLSQYVNSFAQIAGIIIAATMVVVTNRYNSRNADETAQQQIYQSLELESVKLFRFECDHPELVARLWYPELPAPHETTPTPQPVKDYLLKQYICQMLNLFEMACRFHKERIFEADLFGSWVIWMWELCAEDVFQRQWRGEDGIEFNYIESFREIINAGIYFATEQPVPAQGSGSERPELTMKERRHSFFWFVGNVMDDAEYVDQWLGSSTYDTAKFNRYWKLENTPS